MRRDNPERKSRSKLKSLTAYLALAFAGVVVLGGIYFFFVRDKARDLTERNLRFLASIGRQLESTVRSQEEVLLDFSRHGRRELVQAAIESGYLEELVLKKELEERRKASPDSPKNAGGSQLANQRQHVAGIEKDLTRAERLIELLKLQKLSLTEPEASVPKEQAPADSDTPASPEEPPESASAQQSGDPDAMKKYQRKAKWLKVRHQACVLGETDCERFEKLQHLARYCAISFEPEPDKSRLEEIAREKTGCLPECVSSVENEESQSCRISPEIEFGDDLKSELDTARARLEVELDADLEEFLSKANLKVTELKLDLTEAKATREATGGPEVESEQASEEIGQHFFEDLSGSFVAIPDLEAKWKQLVPLIDEVSVSRCGLWNVPSGVSDSLRPGEVASWLDGHWLRIVVEGEQLSSAEETGSAEDVGIRVCARIHLEELLRPVFEQDIFDTLVLARPNGTVVHQREAPELVLARLDHLTEAADGKRDRPAFEALASTTQVLDVVLSGGKYKLFLQPQAIASLKAHVNEEASAPEDEERSPAAGMEGGGGEPLPAAEAEEAGWVVAGLVRARAFRNDSLAISTHHKVLMGLVLLLLMFSYPYLKIWLLNERQRLRLSDVVLLGICSFLGIALMTLVLLDTLAYGGLRGLADEQLEALAADIEKSLDEEMSRAKEQIDELQVRALDYLLLKKGCHVVTGSCGDLLNDNHMNIDSYSPYPFLQDLALIAGDGQQILKWSVATAMTPRASVRERDYFRKVQEEDGNWKTDKRYHLESILSRTDRRPHAVLAKKLPPAGEPSPKSETSEGPTGPEPHPQVIAMRLPMLSLIDPVLPPGFGFAVIDDRGEILFHSEKLRSLGHDLTAETNGEWDLHAALFAQRPKRLDMHYRNCDQRIFVRPLGSFARWSIVTFYGKDVLRDVNVGMLLIASLLLFFYSLFYILLVVGIRIFKPHARLRRIWPVKEKIPAYFHLTFWLILLALAEMWVIRETWHLSFTVLIAAVALLFTYRILRDRESEPAADRLSTRALAVISRILPSWKSESATGGLLRWAYCLAGFSLVVVLVLLPVAAFFQSSYSAHAEALVKYDQLKLARALQERWDRLRSAYGRVEETGDLLTERTKTGLFDVHAGFLFDTEVRSIDRSQGNPPDGSRRGRQNWQAWLIDKVLPYYGRQSAELRELLLSDRSSDGRWQREGIELSFEYAEYADGEALKIVSQVPSFGGSRTRLWHLLRILGFAVLVGVVGWAVYFTARRVLLINFVRPVLLEDEDPEAELASLREKVESLCKTQKPDSSPEEIDAERDDRAARSYYKDLWHRCDSDEKLVLVQLAEEGLVNTKNRRALWSLLTRRLIRLDPEPTLLAPSFRRFVLSGGHHGEVADREPADSPWHRLRGPLTLVIVGALVFFATTQQEFFDSTIGLLGAAAAAIPVVFRLLAFLSPKHAPASSPVPPAVPVTE